MPCLTRPLSLVVLLLALVSLVRAEDGILAVHVSNPNGQPIPGVVLSTKGDSSTAAPTSTEGKTRIKLAPDTQPNKEVSLQIVRAPTELVFVSPWDGRVRVPPFENESQNFASVILIEPGDRAWLEYGIVTLALVSKINATNSLRAGSERVTDQQRLASLSEVAQSYGLTPAEVDAAIRTFGKKTKDPFEIGQVALYERNYPEAEKQLLISRETRKKNLENAIREFADVNFSLGQTFYEQGKYEEAVAAYQEVVKLRPEDSDALNNLGVVLAAIGNYVDAELNFHKALAVDDGRAGLNYRAAMSLSNLAALYDIRGDFKRAEDYYQRGLTIIQQNFERGHPFAISLLDNLVQLQLKMGNKDWAILLQQTITDAIEDYLTKVSGPEYVSFYGDILYREISQAVSIHVRYAGQNPAALRVALLTILRYKARSIDINADQMKSLRKSPDPQDKVLLEQLLAARSQLGSLVLRNVFLKDSELNQASVSQMEARIKALEGAIRVRNTNPAFHGAPITLESIQTEIPPAATLIEFVRYRPLNVRKSAEAEASDPPRYVAYILRKEGEPQWLDLGEAKSIEQDVGKFLAQVQARSSQIKQTARELDQRILQPMRGMFSSTAHLVISPDGLLNSVPFCALIDEQGRYLLQNYLVTYLTSGRHLLRLKSPTKSRSAPLIMADPVFDDKGESPSKNSTRFARLPDTVAEAKAISQMANGYMLVRGTMATETVLKQFHGPAFLHVASMGFFLKLPQAIEKTIELPGDNSLQSEAVTRRKLRLRSGPDTLRLGPNSLFTSGQSHRELYEDYQLLRSGVALAGANAHRESCNDDGVLTALEAMGLDLEGTELVVLSAAFTGLGEIRDADGVYGFRRAIEVAGAKSLVTTLWAVSDRGSSDLMRLYYLQLRKGTGKGESLRQAQLYMLATEEWQHPFFWAPFIQSGDWGVIKQ